jgi:hypothetical protein
MNAQLYIDMADMAVMLFASAAEKGNSKAQCRLACKYQNGCGVVQKKNKAFELFNLAALQGVPQAQYELAFMYLHGIGAVRVRLEAITWISIRLQRRGMQKLFERFGLWICSISMSWRDSSFQIKLTSQRQIKSLKCNRRVLRICSSIRNCI